MKYENGKLTLNENVSKDVVEQFRETACEIEIGEDVTAVETAMFSRWPRIMKVAILSENINWGFGGNFRDCPNLQTVYLAAKTIGRNCFTNCGNLNSFKAPNLVRVKEGAFSGCTNLDTNGVERCRKEGIMAKVGEVLFKDNVWAQKWTDDYENAVNEFSRVKDWRRAEQSVNRLLLTNDNGVSSLGAGQIAIPGVRDLGLPQQGEFCNRLSMIVSTPIPDIAQLSALRKDFFDKTTVMPNARRPILIFNRAICGLAANKIVPIVDIGFMEAVYAWFKEYGILDEMAIGNEGSFERWFDQGLKIHACLAKYVPQFTVYQRGVLAWAVHDDGDKKYNSERAECRARLLAKLFS